MDTPTEQIEPPKMDIVAPRLKDEEFLFLVTWLQAKRDKFPHFCQFLENLLKSEAERRQNPGQEPTMEALPAMNGKELSDCLDGSFCLYHGMPLTENQQRFVFELHKHFFCSASSVISFYLESTPV